jgi:hypothetical protein
MEILVTRSRIAGTLPFYEYRALVPLGALCPDRRNLVRPIVIRQLGPAMPCVNIAQVIAPASWFSAAKSELAHQSVRIVAVARRVEAVLVAACFPEMTYNIVPLVARIDEDPGDARGWVMADDLTNAFGRIEDAMPTIGPDHLGVCQPSRAAA